ncbi:MAG: sigma-54-dependent transcriptional regulator [Acidobacteriota bacterium]
MTKKVLVIDDEPQMRLAMRRVLEKAGHVVDEAVDGADGLARLGRAEFDAVITDVRMPRLDGSGFLARARDVAASTAVIVVSAFGTVSQAVQLVRDGADDYLLKPFPPEALRQSLDAALARRARQVLSRNVPAAVTADLPTPAGTLTAPQPATIQTRDPAMRQLLATAARAASVDATVLIEAESGTGKELLARYIHGKSPRHDRSFVAVNVAALPGQLLESELFGHVRGAFTGAERDRKGWFEIAAGGSLLLDEVGEMPAELQVKLLRVLQERVVFPVGAERPVPVDVRVIAATHRDLAAEVGAGRFREDLFYRLNVLPLRIPPLRDRREDIGLLAHHFAHQHGAAGLDAAAVRRLKSHPWPGNVRELENALQRAAVLGGRRTLTASDFDDLTLCATHRGTGPVASGPTATLSVGTTIDDAERLLIEKTLEAMGGNRTRTAAVLGISVRTLRNKLREYANSPRSGGVAPTARQRRHDECPV